MKFMGRKVCEVHVMLKHHNKLLDETIILGLKVMKRNIPPKKNGHKPFRPWTRSLQFLQVLQVQLPNIQTLPLSKNKATKNQALLINKIFQPTKHFRMVAVLCDTSLVTKGTSRLGKKSDLPGKGVDENSSRKGRRPARATFKYPLPSRKLTYPTWKKENHLQNGLFKGYVSSQEGIP